MNTNTWPSYHQNPLRLSIEEINHPFTTLCHFFQTYHLPDIRTCLNNWLHDALAKETIEAKEHVLTHREVEKLVEAAWVIHQNRKCNWITGESNTTSCTQDNDPSAEIYNKPPRLIEMANSDPFHVIKEVYQQKRLHFLKDNITDWLHVALANDTLQYETGQQRTVLLDFYNQLLLFIEAAYVVIQKFEPEKANESDSNTDNHIQENYNEPTLLSREQIQNPLPVMADFFKLYPITYIRRELWDWCYAGLSYTGTYPNDLCSGAVFDTYDYTLCLIQAGWQLVNSSTQKHCAIRQLLVNALLL
jgi:hypothetical protein